MTTQTVQIMNKIGLHARPAAMLVKESEKFKSEIKIAKGDRYVDAKSIINLLSLQIKQNDTITIKANGSDEKEATHTLAELVRSKFGEE